MKLTRLLALVGTILLSCSAWAQTDVTSTYLTNANFETDDALTSTYLYGYGKDGSPYGFQTITGWTSVVTSGDNSDNKYPNSGMAGGVFSYGSSTQLKGNAKAAPATNPNGEATGKCFGFFGVWGCGGYYYQNVTLAAGKYTITVPMYNQSGTQANTTYTGFFPTSGTNRTVAVNPTVGQWVNQTVTFTLVDDTEGQIRIGYQSTGSGSGANSMLFIDCVKIEFTAIVVKDVLETALTAATKANTTLGDSDLTTAIATAQGVYDDEDATQDEVNAAAATLNAATEIAMSEAGDVTGIFLSNPGFESCDVTTTNAAASGSAAPLNIAGNWTQVSSAAWSSSAVVAYGGSGQVNGASAPTNDNDGNSGNAFGVSVGWGGLVTYQSNAVTLPAGVYTLKVNAYNANSKTQFTSKFGFVPTEGAASLSTKTSFSSNSWVTDQVIFTLNEATEGKIQIGGQAVSGGSGDNAKVFLDNITISYSSFLAGAKAAYDEAVANAATAKSANSNVTGSELIALNTELGKSEPTTVDGYNDATEAINNAIDALVAAAPAYNALVTEIAYAGTLGIDTDDAEAAMDSEATAASVTTATQTLKEDEYRDLLYTDYPNDVTSFLGVWPAGDYGTTSGQGYISDEGYFDKWNGSAMDLTSSSTVELPAGKYVVCVAGRGVSSTTMNLSVKVGDADPVSTPFLMIGDTGKGIDTKGATNFDEGGTYSNGNVGRGWQYRYITFTTTGGNVTITISGHLNAGTWQSFYAPVLKCDDDTYAPIALSAAKAELQAVIDAAPAVRTANIGDGAFQIAEAGVNTYSDALTAAQTAHDAGDATVLSLNDAKGALEEAIATYNALEVNEPADGKLFTVSLASGQWTANAVNFENEAMTYMAGDRADMGGYNIKYNADANTNLAQAFTFTKVSGNNYKMSQIDADGNARYICTGVPHGGNTGQIRTTTDAEQALVVTVIPTATDGKWNLWNTEANNYIGAQDAGVYTVNSHIDFAIAETSKPSITINTTAAGWGTTMLPFAVASLPDGVKAYTCAEANGALLVLEEVDALEANKPYIIEGAWEAVLTGDAQGTALNYTEGLLTGVYEATVAPVETYVLQNQDKVAFYKVVEDNQPTVGANRAYLTAPANVDVKAFFFDEATAIKSVFDGVAAGNIYDMAGRKVSKMQKGGVYVVNGKKVVIK